MKCMTKINGLKILIVEKPETKGTDEIKQLNMFQNLQSDISNSIKNLKYEELMTVLVHSPPRCRLSSAASHASRSVLVSQAKTYSRGCMFAL